MYISLYYLFHIATISHWLLGEEHKFCKYLQKFPKLWELKWSQIKTHLMKRTETTAKVFFIQDCSKLLFLLCFFYSLEASHVDENRRNDSAKPQTSLKTEHEQTENLTSTSVRENLWKINIGSLLSNHTSPKPSLKVDQMNFK